MNQTIFSLLRTSLWGEERYPIGATSDIDWNSVYQELCLQTVQNLPVDLLCQLDSVHRVSYMKAASLSISRFYNLMGEQQKLTRLFEAANIPFAILKGAAAACYYSQPEYRCMGDIDLLVKPEDFDRAYALMISDGFTPDDDGAKDIRHTHLTKNGILYELHRFFSSLNNREQAIAFDHLLYCAIDHADKTEICGFAFYKVPALENGLVLLAHIAQHLEGGLGLRQIIDWMMYVDRELTDTTWYNTFRDAAKDLGLETLAITVTRMCQLYLGLRDDITWCHHAESDLCHELMQLILDRGNFGRKLPDETKKSQLTLLAFRGIRKFFSRLQYRGCRNWSVLNEHPWLSPLAWLYQLFRIICKGLQRKHPIRQLLSDLHTINKSNDLFTRLGIARCGEGFQTPNGTRW